MKNTTIITMAALLLGSSGLMAQTTAFTDPSGFTTVTIEPSSLNAFSVALRNPSSYAEESTSITAAALTQAGASWAVDQWIADPHIVYITNENGGEEAFLITSHTADTLTLSSTFDLTSRYGDGAGVNARRFMIVKAQTFGSLFGTSSVELQTGSLSTADLFYIWDDGGWVTYYHNATNWKKTGSFANANDDVIFPDEGMFMLRRGAVDLSFVFTGSVPTKPQVSTIPGGELTMLGSRYPVGTTVAQLGLQNLQGWQNGSVSSGDRFFLWSDGTWLTYYYNGANWKRSGSFSNVDDEAIPENTMIFVLRESAAAPANAGNTHEIPYTLD